MSQDLAEAVIRWEDPPPLVHRPPRTQTDGAARARRIAAELRSRPGEWAVIAEGARSHVLPSRIRQGALAVWRPAGAYQAAVRTIDGLIVVYARYIGATQ